MDKTNIRKILTSVLAVLLIFSMFTETAFALSGDGSHIGHTGGGSSVSGAYLVPTSNSDHHVGFRFTWLTLGTDGYYSRKAALDVFYKGYNPNSSWGYHIKATVNGTTYRNLSKYEYKRYYDSLTIDREYFSTSTAYKYCNRTDIPVTLPADEDAMTTWGKKEANMNIILNKMVSGATVANMKSSDFIFIEPIYRVKIENTNYCITVTEMGLIGCVVCSATSTGNEGTGYGSGWVTIRRYTNLNWPDALKTDSAHAGISAGTTLSSATSFQNLVNKGYGLMVVWNTNPHLLTVYYTTGTGDASLKISSSYKLASNFSSYSSSYIRNSSDNYFTQSVYYDNNLTLMNGAGSGFNMTRDYYTFSKWQKNGTTSYFNGGSAHKASALNSDVATGNADVTFTAVWTPKEYTITYNLNGGKIGTSSTNPTQKYTYETDVYIGNYSSGATAYSIPSRDGYDFAGWKYTGTTTGYWTKDMTYTNKYHKGTMEHGNITLYAQWAKKTYTVTYNANGGTGAPAAQTKTHGVDLTLSSSKPTRDGYDFVSWNTKSDGSGTTYKSGAKYTANANLTLYAQWLKKTYTVTYNANGGTGAPSAQTKTHGVDLTLSSTKPTRDGYNFTGWNTKSDGTGTAYASGGKYTKNESVTLYAQWSKKTYTVSYNANGGAGAPAAQTKTHGVDLTLSSTKPTRDGYNFTGWNTKSDGSGTAYASGGKYTKNESITLYAQWKLKTYTVTYNANGGTGAPSSQTKTHGVDLTLSSTKPTRDGYNFTGWNTKSDGTGTAYASGGKYTKNENVTLYAQWSKKTYTVSYNANGGTGAPSAQTKTHGVDLTLSSTKPTRDGYDFTGWNTKADGKGTSYASGGKYTKNESVTLYAQWKLKTYTVTFNANGGSGAPAAQTKTHGVDLTLSSTKPTRDGYNFTGWNTKSDGSGTTYASGGKHTKNANLTLYAQWSKKTYTVTYNANGGTGAPSAQTKTHGVDLTLSSTKPTRDGYDFTGWNTKADGKGTAYASGGKYTKNESVTLYAQWSKKTYTVSYNANGGTGAPSAQTKTHGTDLTLSSTKPTRDGYDFTGWNTKADGKGTAYASGGKYTKNESVTLYAQWKLKTYTVTYNANGGTGAPSAQTKTHGVDLTLSSTKPTRDGYNFTGWNTKSDGKGTAYASGGKYTRNESVTFYAQWSKKTYTVTYNANGGTGAPNAQTKTHGTDLTLSSTKPTRDGYDFTGWNTKSDGSGTAYASGGKYTKNESVTLYAQWKLKTYTVTYNANNGTGAPSAQTKTHGVDLTLSSTKPTRDGYNFTGWNTKSDGSGTAYASGGKYTKNENVTLYAQWSKKTYTVSYNANGGTGAPAAQTKTHGTDLTLSSVKPTREGYDFTGWNTKADGKGTAYASGGKYTKNESVTLYAQWKLKTYTVSYNANGGSGAPSAQTKTHGVELTMSSTKPTRDGYDFTGWNTKADGKGTSYASGGKYTKNESVTLYAQWKLKTYTVTYNANGGSGAPSAQTKTHGADLTLSSTKPTRDGYDFTGWNTAANGSGTAYAAGGKYTKNASVTLYAQWKLKTYTVTYNANGGKNAPSSQTKTHGTDLTLSSTKPTRDGYDFTGWNTKTDGTGTAYASGAKYTKNESVTLYAQWKIKTYTVNYNANGGTNAPSAQTKTHGVDLTLSSSKAIRDGYGFSGWNTNASGTGTSYAPGAKYTKNENVTLYAQWNLNTYTVSYDANGGKGAPADQTKKHGTDLTLSTTKPTREGYTFATWNTKADGKGTSYASGGKYTGNADLMLYAIWTPIKYEVKFNGNGSTSGSMSNQSFTYDKEQALTASAFKREYSVTYNYNGNGTANGSAKASATFNGWATSSTGKVVYANKQNVKNLSSSNGAVINVYANWTDGSVTLPAPSRTGYTFSGWYTSASSGTKAGDGGSKYTPGKDITLYAHWTPITYTIKFNGNGSTSGSMSNLSMTYDTAKTLTANAYKRTGYTFGGWDTRSDGTGTAYTDKQSVKNLTATQGATINLYAQWSPIGYAVKYNGNGSTSGSMSNQSFVYDAAQNLTANAFKREFTVTYNYNYTGTTNTTAKAAATFNGWATSSTGSVVYTDKQNVKNLSSTSGEVINLYAKWTDKAVTLPTPSRTGYVFDGWYTASSSGTKIGAGGGSYSPGKDITVYAHWSPINYTIKFNGNGSTSGSMSSLSMTYDTAKTLTANAYKRTGYTYGGWNTKADGTGTAYADKQSVKNLTATQGATITLYAQWSPIGYAVKYNGNGSTSGSMSNQSFVYDAAQNLSANAFKREFTVTCSLNYSGASNTAVKAAAAFNGWATSSTGNVTYADKQSVKNLSSTNGAVVNLYAKWSDAKATLPTPARTGYTFDGWYTSSTGGTKIGGGGSSYTTDKDVTVYAHWTPITYTIKFDGNKATSGTMSNLSMTYDVEKTLTANAYKRTGYTFNGWSTKADGTGTAYADKQSVKNLTATNSAVITLYAQWKPISYTIRFNGNGANAGSMSDLTMSYDVEKALTANGFTKNGAEFVKWNSKADGTGTDYEDKQRVKNLTETDGTVITLYAQWRNLRILSLEAVTPNAAYRESTDVITSFNLVNKGEGACIPADNVSVVFKVYKDSAVIKTVTQNGVVVPGNEKNLLYFKWTVPNGLGSGRIYISAEIVENGESYGLIKNEYATCRYDVYSTPDTQYEPSGPDGFTVPNVPDANSETAKWSVWTYENNAFTKVSYGMAISNAAASITPDDSANAEQQNGVWIMKSGYGYGVTLTNGVRTLSGYTAAPAAAYTGAQYALALFPEFGYAETNGNCRTLELVSGKWCFRENDDYGRVHFTPLWFPDGPYTATVLQSDCWTPAGMITRRSITNTITISGSAYDDWYIG